MQPNHRVFSVYFQINHLKINRIEFTRTLKRASFVQFQGIPPSLKTQKKQKRRFFTF